MGISAWPRSTFSINKEVGHRNVRQSGDLVKITPSSFPIRSNSGRLSDAEGALFH